MSVERRRPRWVYGTGTDPDARFSFANERTFLAWIRTALALLATGVALDSLDLSLSDQVQRRIAALMVALGLLSALVSWTRWARAERALRRGESLPASAGTTLLAIGVGLASVAVLFGR